MVRKRLLLLVPAAAIMLMSACGNDNTGKNGNDSTAVGDSLQNDSSLTDHMVPSPLQVALIFKKSGMKYLPGITLSTDKSSTFSTRIAKAQAMGIYSADMAYSVINKQTQDAQNYLKTIRETASQIDLGKIFDNSTLYDRFTTHVDNEDSIRAIVCDIQAESDMLMSTNQQPHMYGVIYAAAWVESMYIGSKVYQQDQNMKIAPTLIEQLNILESIVKELKNYEKKDPAIPAIYNQLNELHTLFAAIPAIKALNDSEDADISKVTLTKEQLDSLIKKIEEIRNKMVNG